MDGRFFPHRTLELKHHQRQTINVENGIGNAFLTALNLQLVHHSVAVVGMSTHGVAGIGISHHRVQLFLWRYPGLG